MAQFRGTIRGHRGEASRLGGKESGLLVKGHGWKGGASVWLHTVNGEDRLLVELEAHPSEGGFSFTLYEGPATVEAFRAFAAEAEAMADAAGYDG